MDILPGYGYVAIFLLVATGFCVVPLLLSALIRPRDPNSIKDATYECGLETSGNAWIQYRPGFYIFALIFVVFDVETVFLFPWAMVYGQVGLFALIEMIVFVGILALGLAYAWRKGALEF